MNEDDVRRIVRQEIVKAFTIFEAAAEPFDPYETGDFEMALLRQLGHVVNRAADRIKTSHNGSRRQCEVCDAWDDIHEEWCPRGA